MDKKFLSERRKAALMIDNCTALKIDQAVLLQPSTTSQTQPMDQGVICSLKTQYNKNDVRKII